MSVAYGHPRFRGERAEQVGNPAAILHPVVHEIYLPVAREFEPDRFPYYPFVESM